MKLEFDHESLVKINDEKVQAVVYEGPTHYFSGYIKDGGVYVYNIVRDTYLCTIFKEKPNDGRKYNRCRVTIQEVNE